VYDARRVLRPIFQRMRPESVPLSDVLRAIGAEPTADPVASRFVTRRPANQAEARA